MTKPEVVPDNRSAREKSQPAINSKCTLTQLAHGLGIESAPQQKDTMKTKHTPGKLVAFLDTLRTPVGALNSDLIARVTGDTDQQAQANANRLALCWNCHDELVEALQNAANVLAGLATGQLKAITPDSPALKQVRDALRKAGIVEGGE